MRYDSKDAAPLILASFTLGLMIAAVLILAMPAPDDHTGWRIEAYRQTQADIHFLTENIDQLQDANADLTARLRHLELAVQGD